MTALNIATDIPSQINTLEQLAAWCCLALSNTNPTITAIEGVGYSERVAQAGIFFVSADNKHRILTRLSMEVSSEYQSGGSKTWKYVQEISNTPLSSNFKSN